MDGNLDYPSEPVKFENRKEGTSGECEERKVDRLKEMGQVRISKRSDLVSRIDPSRKRAEQTVASF